MSRLQVLWGAFLRRLQPRADLALANEKRRLEKLLRQHGLSRESAKAVVHQFYRQEGQTDGQ